MLGFRFPGILGTHKVVIKYFETIHFWLNCKKDANTKTFKHLVYVKSWQIYFTKLTLMVFSVSKMVCCCFKYSRMGRAATLKNREAGPYCACTTLLYLLSRFRRKDDFKQRPTSFWETSQVPIFSKYCLFKPPREMNRLESETKESDLKCFST